MRKTGSLCPAEGYFAFDEEDECSPMFIKCNYTEDTQNELEGAVFRCPKGYSFWRVSKRCEKREKIPMCRSRTSYEGHARVPIEWINLGRGRSLRQ